MMQEIEQMYTFKEIAERWHVSLQLARKLFKGHARVINVSSAARPSYRIPASVVTEVLTRRGASAA